MLNSYLKITYILKLNHLEERIWPLLLYIRIFCIRPYFCAPHLNKYFDPPRNDNAMIAVTTR